MDRRSLTLAGRLSIWLMMSIVVIGPAGNPNGAIGKVGAVQASCAEDFKRFCSGRAAKSPVQAGCVRQYWMSLSAQCRNALRGRQGDNLDNPDSEQ